MEEMSLAGEGRGGSLLNERMNQGRRSSLLNERMNRAGGADWLTGPEFIV